VPLRQSAFSVSSVHALPAGLPFSPCAVQLASKWPLVESLPSIWQDNPGEQSTSLEHESPGCPSLRRQIPSVLHE
jgi:hypothetical protein